MLKSFYNSSVREAGCDEAGRGPLAGPVVAAAVIFPINYSHQWLTDSKMLNKTQRVELVSVIKENALSWAIAEVSNNDIDQINILKASIKAMHLAVDQLKVRPEHLLIDGNKFYPYPMIPHTCVVKGDQKYLAIAAASILAKTHRDDLMEKLSAEYQGYGWEHNFGYPTKFHREAIARLGTTPYHRLSFNLLGEIL
ncbi:MAG: ribonuclease HII [Bacteroidota bacterium]